MCHKMHEIVAQSWNSLPNKLCIMSKISKNYVNMVQMIIKNT